MRIRTNLFSALCITIGFAALIPTVSSAQSGNVQEFTSHGIHVVLRQSNANQVVSAVLGFEGGLAYNETDNAAIANATAGVISSSGSDKYPKDVFRDTLAKLSTSIGGSGDLYHMLFTMQTIRPSFNSAWDIFSDLMLHPHYDTIEAENLREQWVNSIASRPSNTEAYAGYLVDSIWRSGSSLNRTATADEVKGLSFSDLMNYRNSQFQRSRALLVVVGDISRAELEQKIASLAALPEGSFTKRDVPTIKPQLDQMLYIPRELPTTYVELRAPSANISSNDWWAERVLLQILDKRLFDQIRTKRNLSYSPQAYATGDFQNYYSAMSLQSILPDSATHVLYDVVKGLQQNLVSSTELENAKAARITTYYYVLQKNLSQATALYSFVEQGAGTKYLFSVVPETQKVTAEQVRKAAEKYFHHFSFVVIGPEGKSTESVYRFE